MGMKDNYRNIILEMVQKKAGFSFDQAGIPARQWNRITALSGLLHEVMVLEQMIKVEKMQSRHISSRISSKLRPSKASELDTSYSSLERAKEDVWTRCDELAYDIIREKDHPGTETGAPLVKSSSEALKCRSCGGVVTVMAYNNFKCEKCGLGYSAKDFLELLRKDINEI